MIVAYKTMVIAGTLVTVFTVGAIVGFINLNDDNPSELAKEITAHQSESVKDAKKTDDKKDDKSKTSDDKKSETKSSDKKETTAASDDKTTSDNSTSNATAAKTSESTNKPAPKPADNKPTAHTHTWVNHEIQVPHEEQYIVREWDEEVPAGKEPSYDTYFKCSVCGGEIISEKWFETHKYYEHEDYVNEHGPDSITFAPVKVKIGEHTVYETQHKVEYGTRMTYKTEVDYVYCSECGEHK